MLALILFAISCGVYTRAQEGEIIVPADNITQCINDLVEWCNGMQYPQQGAGMAALSLTYEDPKGYYRVFCISDSDGTNCTRNREPWFSCSPDHVLAYKGEVLTNASRDVDNDICRTADKAFNELFVQNLSYDNTTLQRESQKAMEHFFEQMAYMEEQISLIQRYLNNLQVLPKGIFSDGDGGIQPQESSATLDADSTTVVPSGIDMRESTPTTTTTEDQSNQVERK